MDNKNKNPISASLKLSLLLISSLFMAGCGNESSSSSTSSTTSTSSSSKDSGSSSSVESSDSSSSSTSSTSDSSSSSSGSSSSSNSSSSSSSSTPKAKYTITWKNDDGTILETDTNVEEGSTPSYDGTTPVKDSTASYSYLFKGWDKTITPVTEDTTYTATYSSSPIYSSVGLTYYYYSGTSSYSVSGEKVTSSFIKIPSTYDDGTNGSHSVTIIDMYAFQNNKGLKGVDIPSTITNIWTEAFDGCSSLESLSLPSSVLDVNDGSFYGCYGITSLSVSSDNQFYTAKDNCLIDKNNQSLIYCFGKYTIPTDGSITSISNTTFDNIKSVKSLVVPASVTSVSSRAFVNHPELESISVEDGSSSYKMDGNCLYNTEYNNVTLGFNNSTIPSTAISINDYAFYGRNLLTSITLPSSLTNIGNYAFCNCTSLKEVTVPSDSQLKTIGEVSFFKDSALDTFNFPASLTSIGYQAFYGAGLTSISFPASLTTLSNGAFKNCSKITSISFPASWSITSMGDTTFQGCSSLLSVTIPDVVTDIPGYAFSDCTSLKSVTLPKSLTKIYTSTFAGCSVLETITLDSTNTTYTINNGCLILVSSKSLICGTTKATIPTDGSVTTIDEKAFSGRTGITDLVIPDTITSIGSFAFADSSIASISIGSGLTSFTAMAFSMCPCLTTITVSGDNKTFHSEGNCLINSANAVVAGCKGSTVIPSSVTSIAANAFDTVNSLESLEIGKNVASIDVQAFSFCGGLTSLTVDDENTTYRDETNCVIERSSNTLVLGCQNSVIPSSVTTIGQNAFYGCSTLKNIIIPSSVTTICTNAFSCCTSFEQLIIPSTVTTIGNGAFYTYKSSTFFFEATVKDDSWVNIMDSDNSTVYWYSETSNTDGSHWHYVNNVPTVWED